MSDEALEEWLLAAARATALRDRADAARTALALGVRERRWRVLVTDALATIAVTASIAAQAAVLTQSPHGPADLWKFGPYVVPVVGVIVSYASLRTAFLEHQRAFREHQQATAVARAADKVALDAALEARARRDIVEVKIGALDEQVRHVVVRLDGLQHAVGEIAVGVAALRGTKE